MYIVIPLPAVNSAVAQLSYSFVSPSSPIYFNTREEVLNYIRTNNGRYRIFEAKELTYNVDVSLQEKEENINDIGWNFR